MLLSSVDSATPIFFWSAGSNSSCLVLLSSSMKGVYFALFPSKTLQRSCCLFQVFSPFPRTCLKISTSALLLRVADSLVMRRLVRNVDCAQVVQIQAVGFIPPNCPLGNLKTLNRSAICLGLRNNDASWHLWRRPWLSNKSFCQGCSPCFFPFEFIRKRSHGASKVSNLSLMLSIIASSGRKQCPQSQKYSFQYVFGT